MIDVNYSTIGTENFCTYAEWLAMQKEMGKQLMPNKKVFNCLTMEELLDQLPSVASFPFFLTHHTFHYDERTAGTELFYVGQTVVEANEALFGFVLRHSDAALHQIYQKFDGVSLGIYASIGFLR